MMLADQLKTITPLPLVSIRLSAVARVPEYTAVCMRSVLLESPMAGGRLLK